MLTICQRLRLRVGARYGEMADRSCCASILRVSRAVFAIPGHCKEASNEKFLWASSVQGQDTERVVSCACGNSGTFHVEMLEKPSMRTRRFPIDQWSIFT